ncbi:MAG: ATP synthase F1 subunit gamma [Patescibacteria group bacterium]
MANTRELRRRIKSVKNTSQITRAMQMVAAVKMRKAQEQALNGRPYSENLSEALERLLPRVDIIAHPLLGGKEIASSSKTPRNDKVGVVLLTTDKGLVGALNTNIMRAVIASHSSSGNVFYTVGKKGRSFVVRTGKDLAADFENSDLITFRQAVQLSKLVTESFLAGEVREVYLVYPHFVSTLKQEPRKGKLLPISISDIEYRISEEQKEKRLTINDKRSNEFLYEPNVDALLDSILIHSVQTRIYQALLETKASEHSSRMVAMKNATDNAKELVEDLTLNYNQVRQDSITREILEISSASAAME